jgi:hypothetical protein
MKSLQDELIERNHGAKPGWIVLFCRRFNSCNQCDGLLRIFGALEASVRADLEWRAGRLAAAISPEYLTCSIQALSSTAGAASAC